MEDHPVIASLLQRISSGQGFAGLGSSIQVMSQLDNDDLGINQIVEVILRDAALTARLLRLANSSNRASRNISTIDQAINLIGLNTVKNVTISLSMLDSMSNKPQSAQLHGEIAAAYFCGALAAQVTRANGARFSAQEAQVCGLLQNLGRMMVVYYLYDEIEKAKALQADENLSQDDAVAKILGVSLGEIGSAVAQQWKLPDTIINSLSPAPFKAPPRAAATALDWNLAVAVFARRITDAVFRAPESQERMLLQQEIQFFRTALQLKDDETQQWIKTVFEDTSHLLSAIGFPITLESAQSVLRKASERVLDTLGAQDSLAAKAPGEGGKSPIEIIQQMLRLIHNECKFDLTMLLLPNGTNALIAIAGLGRKANQVTPIFRCHGQKPDIFRLIANKKVDMYVADTQSPSFKQFIPDWYNHNIEARSFMLFSLIYEGNFAGMIYGDYTEPRAAAPAEATGDKVKEWRTQMAHALNLNKAAKKPATQA